MSMATRQGSLAWVVIVSAITIGIMGALWGLFDSVFVSTLTSTDIWSAEQGSAAQIGRQYVITTWDWLLLIVLLRIGIEGLVASRLTGISSSMIAGAVVVFITHLLIVVWVLVFPEIISGIYDVATGVASESVEAAGYMEAIDLAVNWGVGYIPAILLLIVDGWFIVAPIRHDALGR